MILKMLLSCETDFVVTHTILQFGARHSEKVISEIS